MRPWNAVLRHFGVLGVLTIGASGCAPPASEPAPEAPSEAVGPAEQPATPAAEAAAPEPAEPAVTEAPGEPAVTEVPAAEPEPAAEAEPATPAEPAASQTSRSQPTAAELAAVELQVVDKAGFDQVIAGLEGRVVLVDFWATWCGPCLTNMPHTASLARDLADQGLTVVTLSIDDLEVEDAARTVLAQHAGPMVHLLSSHGVDSFDLWALDQGTIPAYWIYDRQGQLVRRISPSDPTQSFDIAQVDAAVHEVLAEQGEPAP